MVAEVVGGWPCWYTLEAGELVGLHAHVLTVTEAVPTLPDLPGLHGAPVWSLSGVLAYLSKPRDARAARSPRRRAASLSGVLAAAEDHLSARAAAAAAGRSRLPAGSGVLNVPPCRSRSAAPPPGLILACLLPRLAHRAAVLASRRLRERRAPPPQVEHRTVRRWHLHGLPAAPRRPVLIGHARPPPIGEPRGWQRLPVRAASRVLFTATRETS